MNAISETFVIFCSTLVVTFWNFLLFYQIFLPSQVKRNVFTSNKNGTYELPHELPNDIRLRI